MTRRPGGTQLLLTHDRVWVARDGLLVAVDPQSGSQSGCAGPGRAAVVDDRRRAALGDLVALR